LKISIEATAQGIIDVVNAHMVRAIKVISLERGHDPRDFALVAFGGAGGLHACELAEMLGITTVLLPATPGLNSAVGMLGADLTREVSRSVLRSYPAGTDLSGDEVAREVARLERAVDALLDAQGRSAGARSYEVYLDLRYVGQSFELSITLPTGLTGIREAFSTLHEERYGYRMDNRALEWVNLRVRARDLSPERSDLAFERSDLSLERSESPERSDLVCERDDLPVGESAVGPLVITEYSATTWVPGGWRVTAHAGGVLILEPIR
jgi:N-methylhydantoinase A